MNTSGRIILCDLNSSIDSFNVWHKNVVKAYMQREIKRFTIKFNRCFYHTVHVVKLLMYWKRKTGTL